ncbi:MAG: o-succinylbenzoate synthase [bacterium]
MNPFRADFKQFTLEFIHPMGTSRGVLHERDTFIITLSSDPEHGQVGLGECAPLPGLSIDARPGFANKLQDVCDELNSGYHPSDLNLIEWPAIRFGLESALLDFERGGVRVLFDSDFTQGRKSIPINGLIVMADVETMLQQAFHKIEAGFDCIKIKVGALDFEAECALLQEIRKRCPAEQIQLRLDANGAFEADTALEKLRRLHEFTIHSIEQPMKAGQTDKMAELCKKSPIPIALDEELIGVRSESVKKELLRAIQPQYIILKPTLVGGLQASEEWISLADNANIGYWITSALESNIGLNAISQWTSTLPVALQQGLGTGRLFVTNFRSPLKVENGRLWHNKQRIAQNCKLFKDHGAHYESGTMD